MLICSLMTYRSCSSVTDDEKDLNTSYIVSVDVVMFPFKKYSQKKLEVANESPPSFANYHLNTKQTAHQRADMQ